MTLENISNSKKLRFFKRKIKKLVKKDIYNPFSKKDRIFIEMKRLVIQMHVQLSYNPVGCEGGFHKLERFYRITYPVFTRFKEILKIEISDFKKKRHQEFFVGLKDFFEIDESVEYDSTSSRFVVEKRENLSKIIKNLAQN